MRKSLQSKDFRFSGQSLSSLGDLPGPRAPLKDAAAVNATWWTCFQWIASQKTVV